MENKLKELLESKLKNSKPNEGKENFKKLVQSIKEKKLQKSVDNKTDLDKQLEEFKERVKARLAKDSK